MGDTYAFSPNISEGEAYRVWVEEPHETYVALEEGDDRILGTYYIKPNQPTLGAHVCNCGYVVATTARGRGIATAMCIHSQQEAKQLGFIAMQFNLVVSTNISAIRLWQKLGFEIIGTLPKAFRHSAVGFVDALVMYKTLQ
ncbi:acetyltransferase, GNAT family [Synechococcus sp. PCC 7335]|nr:acetyltransferase, GNAT family [Synechococcus sp. PCC 7335]